MASSSGLRGEAWKVASALTATPSMAAPWKESVMTAAAEAMTRELEALGYDALTYYQMD